jgi:2'-5' RNA ligase
LNNILSDLQSKIQKAARQNEYYFDIEKVNEHGFHITLETALNVDEKDLRKCNQCIRESFNKLKKKIDLTSSVAKAHFKIIGHMDDWGVLTFPAPKLLADLRKNIRECLKASKLQVSNFKDFNSHISLGKFLMGDQVTLPSNDDLEWVPNISIKLPKKYFVVEGIKISPTEMPDNKKEKEEQQLLTAAAAYPPAQQPPIKPQPKKTKEKKAKPIAKEESSGFGCAVQ